MLTCPWKIDVASVPQFSQDLHCMQGLHVLARTLDEVVRVCHRHQDEVGVAVRTRKNTRRIHASATKELLVSDHSREVTKMVLLGTGAQREAKGIDRPCSANHVVTRVRSLASRSMTRS